MVEHAVQDDVHAVLFGCVHQLLEVTQGAQDGVDGVVIAGIVAMVGDGVEYGVQIDHRNAQRLQVVDLLGDALQVTAVDLVGILTITTESVDGIPGLILNGRIFGQHIPAGELIVHTGPGEDLRTVIALVTVEEAVREDLIDHSVLQPVGGLEAVLVNHQIVRPFLAGGNQLASAPISIVIAVDLHITRYIAKDEVVPVVVAQGGVPEVGVAGPQNCAVGGRFPGCHGNIHDHFRAAADDHLRRTHIRSGLDAEGGLGIVGYGAHDALEGGVLGIVVHLGAVDGSAVGDIMIAKAAGGIQEEGDSGGGA